MVGVAQYVVDGIVFSCIIVLGSVGLSLVYSIADFANFAHGDTMTVGAFGALVGFYGFYSVFPGGLLVVYGFPVVAFLFALAVGMGIAALTVVLTELVVYRPLDTGSIELLITSIGVAFAYRAIVQNTFGTGSQTYTVGRSGPIKAIQESLGVTMTVRGMVIIIATIVLVVALHALLQYTTLGRKMRAMSDDVSLARVSGIRTDKVIIAMWIIGGALAAAGGVFLGMDTLVRPRMGFDLLLVIFAAVILGGIGSVYGAMLGGFAIGMAHELTPLLPVVGIEYKSAIAFVLMIVILLLRPQGIMGGDSA